jgi:O-acetyl-ADP-ribose deacetylase (regulator of RNase III)
MPEHAAYQGWRPAPLCPLQLRLVRHADIASWPADAIVSSSNAALAPNNNAHYWRFAGREGTNGAIHAAAGPELLEACRVFGDVDLQRIGRGQALNRRRRNIRCAVGEAVSTPAFGALRCEHVIHAVTPDGMFDQGPESCYLLAQSYSSVLAQCGWLAVDHVAMPALGCGVHGWNLDDAAEIGLRAIAKHGNSAAVHPRWIDLCFKEDEAWDAFRQAATSLLGFAQSKQTGDKVGTKHEMEVWRVGPSTGARAAGRL